MLEVVEMPLRIAIPAPKIGLLSEDQDKAEVMNQAIHNWTVPMDRLQHLVISHMPSLT